jgi:putative transposase
VVVPECLYHIVQRGNNHQEVFFDDEDRQQYLNLLYHYSRKWNCPILAYCLMTNHVHLLVETKTVHGLAKLMQGISLCHTQRINKKYSRTGRLWECRFHSSLIEKENYLWRVFRYIDRNPVRIGWVCRAEEYPWSSARAHLLGEKNSILNIEFLSSDKDHEMYRVFLSEIEDENGLAEIRRMTQQDRPLGPMQFQLQIEKLIKRKVIPRPRGRPKRTEKR